MQRSPWPVCLAVTLLGCQSAMPESASRHQASPGAAPAQSSQEVVAAVEELFSHMRTRDTASLRQLLDSSLVIVAHSTGADGAPRISYSSTTQFVRNVAASTAELRERMWSPEVRVDGSLATLWAPYDFHRGDQFSHCGHDAVQLARRSGRWVITGLAYTVRRTDCPPAPAR